MAESLCQKRALEAFRLDPAKWGGMRIFVLQSSFIKPRAGEGLNLLRRMINKAMLELT